MTRNLKALGLSMVAVLAMSAFVASAAHAEAGEVTAGAYPATISGVQTNENVLSNGVRSVTCATASLTGTLSAASSTVSITPSYSNCSGNGSTTATVNTNGCSYLLHVTTQTSESTGTGTVDVVCPEGKRIQIDIWATGQHPAGPKLCRLEVPAQNGVNGGEYHNVTAPSGKKGIELTFNANNVRVLRVEGTSTACGAAEKVNGTYTGNVLGTATSEGVATDLFID